MVFSYDAHCTCLWTLLSHLLDEPNFGTDRQMVEGVIENTIAVEKNLAAIGGFNEPVYLLQRGISPHGRDLPLHAA